jgi:hypothetical protein
LGIGEGLLAGRPKSKSGMRPHSFQKHHDGLGDRTAVAPEMQIPQQFERIGDLRRCGRDRRTVDRRHGIETANLEGAVLLDLLPKKEESLVVQREERPAQGCEDAELVIGAIFGLSDSFYHLMFGQVGVIGGWADPSENSHGYPFLTPS